MAPKPGHRFEKLHILALFDDLPVISATQLPMAQILYECILSPAILARLFYYRVRSQRGAGKRQRCGDAWQRFQPHTPHGSLWCHTKGVASFISLQRLFGPGFLPQRARVLALCPGPVDTAFFKVLGSRKGTPPPVQAVGDTAELYHSKNGA